MIIQVGTQNRATDSNRRSMNLYARCMSDTGAPKVLTYRSLFSRWMR